MKKRHKMKNSGLIATLAVLSMMIGLFMTVPVRAAAVDNLSNAEKNSSYGFFIWLSETLPEDDDKEDALIAAKLLKNEIDDRYNSIVFNQGNISSSTGSNLTYHDLLGQTDIGAADDATSLSFLEEAISYAEQGNAYRAKESLAPLKISSALMAIAELDVNYQGYNGFWGHPLVFNCLENLAVVYGSYWPIDYNPYSGWYDKEKTNFDTNNGGITGHYKTLTDRNGEMLTTGFAIRVRHDSEKNSQYYSQQFSNNYLYNIGNGFTPARYKELLKEYHCVVLGHKMKKTEAEPPTCEEDGRIAYYTCENCGKKFADEEGKTEVTDLTDPATGHQWKKDYTIDKEATCTEEGIESIHCSVCDKIKEDSKKVIPAKGHTKGEPVRENEKGATCQTEGSYEEVVYCQVCKAELSRETKPIAKTEHEYGDWITTKEATCTEPGQREKECAKCKEKVSEAIPAAGHQWKEDYTVDKEATCTEEGTESIHCSVCDEIQKGSEKVISKKEHTKGEPVRENEKDATCQTEGSYEEVVYCQVCKAELSRETKPIAKTEHKYGDWTITKEAACTEPGQHEKVCAECGNKVTEEIKATGHQWKKDYTVDKEATCTEEGTESIHCSVCNKIKEDSERIIPLIAHSKGNPVRENEKDATCQTEGSYEEVVYCQVCSTELSRETKPIAKTEHKYGDWITTKEAACTEPGQREKECAKCGDKVTGEIPATGHNYTEVITKNATCTENGVKSYTCKTCNHSYTESIPMKEHTLVTDNAVAPTYDRTGLTEGSHCSVCGKVIKKQEVVPVLQKKNDPANVNNPSSVAALEKKVTQNRNDGDIKGSTFKLLQLKAKKVSKNSITLTWTKVKNADGYIIYGNMCNTGGKKYQFKVLETLKGTSWKHVKLKKGTYYKYMAVAYKMENGFQKVLASSKTVHAATTGGKVGNYQYVKVNKKSVKLKKGKTFAIKPKQIPSSNKLKVKKHRAVCYESSNTNVAGVSKRGVIKAKKKGSCVVYVYSQSGVFTKVKVTVK